MKFITSESTAMNEFYTIMINGQKAVDAGYKFCNGYCYRRIQTHGKFLGQLEVVIDEPGQYNGLQNKWVSVAFIENGKDVEKTLKALSKIGFSGCPCVISLDQEYDDEDLTADDLSYLYEIGSGELCCMII